MAMIVTNIMAFNVFFLPIFQMLKHNNSNKTYEKTIKNSDLFFKIIFPLNFNLKENEKPTNKGKIWRKKIKSCFYCYFV